MSSFCARTMSATVTTGKSSAVLPARGRVDAVGPADCPCTPDDVGADHEVAIGVEALAGADHGLPPAGLVLAGVVAGRVRVAGERVQDQRWRWCAPR